METSLWTISALDRTCSKNVDWFRSQGEEQKYFGLDEENTSISKKTLLHLSARTFWFPKIEKSKSSGYCLMPSVFLRFWVMVSWGKKVCRKTIVKLKMFFRKYFWGKKSRIFGEAGSDVEFWGGRHEKFEWKKRRRIFWESSESERNITTRDSKKLWFLFTCADCSYIYFSLPESWSAVFGW